MNDLNTVTIDASLIGISKKFEVKTTQGAVRRAIAMMKLIAQSDLDREEAKKTAEEKTESNTDEAQQAEPETDDVEDTKSFISGLDKQLDQLDQVDNYVIKELGLNKTQTAKLDDTSVDNLMVFAGVIAMAVLGITEANPTEDDQKSNAV